MIWIAIIPLNWGRDCKTRLASRLTRVERDTLVEAMARHVVGTVRAALGASNVLLLSPVDPMIAGAKWMLDTGGGLNAALSSAMPNSPTLIVHADLPLLETADIEMLIAAAGRNGVAIAPDRMESGTNALALVAPRGIVPAFGEDSLAHHRLQFPDSAIVRTPGLATDIDTPDDLDFVGHRLPDMTCTGLT